MNLILKFKLHCMKNQEKHLSVLIDDNELKEISGGWIGFVAGIAVGYVFGEIMQGIYQANKKGCI
jgi:hypothetical protein